MLNERLNDQIHELSYEAVRRSPLFDSLESNNAIDAKANELADLLEEVVSSFIDQECGSSVLLESEPLKSAVSDLEWNDQIREAEWQAAR